MLRQCRWAALQSAHRRRRYGVGDWCHGEYLQYRFETQLYNLNSFFCRARNQNPGTHRAALEDSAVICRVYRRMSLRHYEVSDANSPWMNAAGARIAMIRHKRVA